MTTRTERFITWLLAKLGRERFVIGRPESPYLTRWTLIGKRFEGSHRLFLHLFHRSDHDVLHDHPWNFWSLIIWPGYWEQTREWDDESIMYCLRSRMKLPGMLLRRRAEHVHRVVLFGDKTKCWTIVWSGSKVRSWGFWCGAVWRSWKQFVIKEADGLEVIHPVCEETP